MECIKSKPISLSKALEKLDRFVSRNAASQADALAAQQAAQAAADRGDQEDEAARSSAFMQHRINHISPDVYHSLQLMRDAMRKEVEQQGK